MTQQKASSSFRQRMRANGLPPVQVWVLDTRSDAFAVEAHRQSHLVAAHDRDAAEQDFIESVSVDWHEE